MILSFILEAPSRMFQYKIGNTFLLPWVYHSHGQGIFNTFKAGPHNLCPMMDT